MKKTYLIGIVLGLVLLIFLIGCKPRRPCDGETCGNGICSASCGENIVNCPEDCDLCYGVICGDGTCEADCGETIATCEADCGGLCDGVVCFDICGGTDLLLTEGNCQVGKCVYETQNCEFGCWQNDQGVSCFQPIELNKETAMEFGLSVVQDYFNDDCDSAWSKFVKEGQIDYGESEFRVTKDQFCVIVYSSVNIPPLAQNNPDDARAQYNYNDYLQYYDNQIITYNELLAKFGQTFGMTQDELLFLGAKANSEILFVWDDPYIFFIGKVDNQLKITGFLEVD